ERSGFRQIHPVSADEGEAAPSAADRDDPGGGAGEGRPELGRPPPSQRVELVRLLDVPEVDVRQISGVGDDEGRAPLLAAPGLDAPRGVAAEERSAGRLLRRAREGGHAFAGARRTAGEEPAGEARAVEDLLRGAR